MNYKLHYERLVERARVRVLPKEVYTERHHVIPRCLGGTDEKDNLVRLTAEEHFVAHQLLVKMFPDNNNLLFAVRRMCSSNPSMLRKDYGWIKAKCSLANKTRVLSKEAHDKMSAAARGRRHSEESRNKMSVSAKARSPHSEETRKKISDAKKGKPYPKGRRGRVTSEETRKKISAALKVIHKSRKIVIKEGIA